MEIAGGSRGNVRLLVDYRCTLRLVWRRSNPSGRRLSISLAAPLLLRRMQAKGKSRGALLNHIHTHALRSFRPPPLSRSPPPPSGQVSLPRPRSLARPLHSLSLPRASNCCARSTCRLNLLRAEPAGPFVCANPRTLLCPLRLRVSLLDFQQGMAVLRTRPRRT